MASRSRIPTYTARFIYGTSIQPGKKVTRASTNRDSTTREWREREDAIGAISRISRFGWDT
jgi:hypothetical protein